MYVLLRSLDFAARNAEYISDCSEDALQDVLRRIEPILF